MADVHDYVRKKEKVRRLVLEAASQVPALEVEVTVNAADDLDAGHVFLAVTGTSAEAGDDGEAGRDNRTSGLITPYRAMTIEAAAGKNRMKWQRRANGSEIPQWLSTTGALTSRARSRARTIAQWFAEQITAIQRGQLETVRENLERPSWLEGLDLTGIPDDIIERWQVHAAAALYYLRETMVDRTTAIKELQDAVHIYTAGETLEQ